MIGGVVVPYAYRVSKYDPVDRDEHGRYVGAESPLSDHGPVEAAYLAAVAAFAQESGVSRASIRDPGLTVVNFGLEPVIDGHGLAELFPPDLRGFHDGAEVSLEVGLALVRAMLRSNGAFCRLEVDDRFVVEVGFDQNVYVGSAVSCDRAVALTHQSGLFAEPMDPSSLATADDDAGERCPADAAWWAAVSSLVAQRDVVMLEEGYVLNASRWHRVTATTMNGVRAELAPRSRLWVWPDLSTDVEGVLAALAVPDDLREVVWQDRDGRIRSRLIDDEDRASLSTLLADACAATVVSCMVERRHSLLAGVLPDADGVLRARWSTQ